MPIDFVKFSINATKIIDEIRSTGADPKNLNNNSAMATESRINAFYRGLGLPAIRINENLEIDESNNGNLFPNTPGNANKRTINYDHDITEEEIRKFVESINFLLLPYK